MKESHRLVAGPMPASSKSEERPTTLVSTKDMIGPASHMPSVGIVKRKSAARVGTACLLSAMRWKGVDVGLSVSGVAVCISGGRPSSKSSGAAGAIDPAKTQCFPDRRNDDGADTCSRLGKVVNDGEILPLGALRKWRFVKAPVTQKRHASVLARIARWCSFILSEQSRFRKNPENDCVVASTTQRTGVSPVLSIRRE